MNKIKQLLSSPSKIAVFAICVVLIIALLAFAAVKIGATLINNQGIGLEQATKVALQSAGYDESDAALIRGHFDREDGLRIYEIEFRAGGYDYKYDVSADDGTIIEAQREFADVQFPEQPSADNQQPAQSSDPQPSGPSQQSNNYIGVERAQEIALQNAGIAASAATFTKAKTDREDGIYIYEIEFVSGDYEYSYEISATDGVILDKDIDSRYD